VDKKTYTEVGIMEPRKSEVDFRRELRRLGTRGERLLWGALRNRHLGGYKFRRQHSIEEYYVDFVCLQKKLVIEIDGASHEGQIIYDRIREADLKRLGFNVMRFTEDEVVENLEGVFYSICVFLGVPYAG